MWKSQIGHDAKKIMAVLDNDPDEWDTDPDFVVCVFSRELTSVVNS